MLAIQNISGSVKFPMLHSVSESEILFSKLHIIMVLSSMLPSSVVPGCDKREFGILESTEGVD